MIVSSTGRNGARNQIGRNWESGWVAVGTSVGPVKTDGRTLAVWLAWLGVGTSVATAGPTGPTAGLTGQTAGLTGPTAGLTRPTAGATEPTAG